MKVAVIQFKPEFGDVAGNLDRAVDTMAGHEADLFVLPELILSGYLFESTDEALALSQEPGGPEFMPVVDLASDKRAVVVLGFAERAGGAVYNSSILISPDGSRSVYRKIQLFCDEKRIFEPGDRRPFVTEVRGARLGMMICFDWVFPEVARTLALAGADILCHPSNLVLPFCQDAMVTRCIENRVFAMTANRVGTESRAGQTLTFTGRSQIVASNGEILVRASDDTEEIIEAEIDHTEARNKMMTATNDVLADRRAGLYELR